MNIKQSRDLRRTYIFSSCIFSSFLSLTLLILYFINKGEGMNILIPIITFFNVFFMIRVLIHNLRMEIILNSWGY